jgi:hypothetical protein
VPPGGALVGLPDEEQREEEGDQRRRKKKTQFIRLLYLSGAPPAACPPRSGPPESPHPACRPQLPAGPVNKLAQASRSALSCLARDRRSMRQPGCSVHSGRRGIIDSPRPASVPERGCKSWLHAKPVGRAQLRQPRLPFCRWRTRPDPYDQPRPSVPLLSRRRAAFAASIPRREATPTAPLLHSPR